MVMSFFFFIISWYVVTRSSQCHRIAGRVGLVCLYNHESSVFPTESDQTAETSITQACKRMPCCPSKQTITRYQSLQVRVVAAITSPVEFRDWVARICIIPIFRFPSQAALHDSGPEEKDIKRSSPRQIREHPIFFPLHLFCSFCMKD